MTNIHEKEFEYSHELNLISTTTPDSTVTYANNSFCDVAGYKQSELIDNHHNIVRHPDMPKKAFEQMWHTIKSGKSWMGIVKNARKGGGFYWVSAFITPITDESDNIIEYQSVRSKPELIWKSRAQKIYQKLHTNGEVSRFKLPRLNYSWLRVLSAIIVLISSLALLNGAPISTFCSVNIVTLSFLMLSEWRAIKSLTRLKKLATDTYNNPLMELIYTGRYDSYSNIELALIKSNAELRAVVARSAETSQHIHQSSKSELEGQEKIKENLRKQSIETDSLATAMEEMTHSIRDVANSAKETSALIDQVDRLAHEGTRNVESTIVSITQLHEELASAKKIISDLSESSQQIESILEVIGAIADQTNLLALNAAIEAARAGKSGRGFAVVADEVRKLASKTRASTGEIHNMISQLQETANDAVIAMENGDKLSTTCGERAEDTDRVLQRVYQMLNDVSNAGNQIAVAVNQQAIVTEEINNNVSSIQSVSDENFTMSGISVDRASKLTSNLENLQRLIKQFQKIK